MKTCTKCEKEKPESEFYLKRGKPNSWCKVCSNESTKKAMAKRRRQVKEILIDEAGGQCVDCSNQFPPFVYDFDHRDPNTKEFNVSSSDVLGIASLRKEAAKCDLVCANCHRYRTHRQRCQGCIYCN